MHTEQIREECSSTGHSCKRAALQHSAPRAACRARCTPSSRTARSEISLLAIPILGECREMQSSKGEMETARRLERKESWVKQEERRRDRGAERGMQGKRERDKSCPEAAPSWAAAGRQRAGAGGLSGSGARRGAARGRVTPAGRGGGRAGRGA